MASYEVDELKGIAQWLQAHAAKLIQDAASRKDSADCMANASAAELKAANSLSSKMAGRKLPALTVREARVSADRDRRIATKLDGEACRLMAWAKLLMLIAADPPEAKEN